MVLDAGGPLGGQIALQLALEGCQVIGVGSSRQALERVGREVLDVNGRFDGVVVDQTDPALAGRAAQVASEGNGGIDYLINAAGPQGHPEDDAGRQRWPISFYRQFLAGHNGPANEPPHHIVDLPRALPADGGVQRGLHSLALAAAIGLRNQRSAFAHSGSAADRSPVRVSCLYLNGQDSSPFEATASLVLSKANVFESGLMADEVLRLLVESGEAPFQDVAIRLSGQEALVDVHWYVPTNGRDRSQRDGRVDHVQMTRRSLPAWMGNIIVRETDRGRGVFARRLIRRGDLVLRATGRIIAHQTEHSVQIGWNSHLETDPPLRFVNHACEPNAGIRTNDLGLPDLIAFQDIRAGEEITFDYAMTEYTHYRRENPELEFSLSCRCGSPNCRGKLGYYSELPADLKRAYAGFVADYLVASG